MYNNIMSDIDRIKAIISANEIVPTRSLGQNFLADETQILRIVRLLDPGPEDMIIEVGPGTGSLTEHITGKCHSLSLIEIDRHLIPLLRTRFSGIEGVRIIHADAMKLELSDIILTDRPIMKKAARTKLISNVPYYITTPLINRFVSTVPSFDRIVVTVQTEAAERIMSKPGDEGYGILPVLASLMYEVRIADKIPAHCFYPQPGVESSVMVLDRKTSVLLDKAEKEGFIRFLKTAFGHRRKQLVKVLRVADGGVKDYTFINEYLVHLGYSVSARAQEITPEDLYRVFQKYFKPDPDKDHATDDLRTAAYPGAQFSAKNYTESGKDEGYDTDE